MNTRNIKQDMDALRALLPKLMDGSIYAIEFGDPALPKGFMAHHRIRRIPTHSGFQICFKMVSRRMEGSGHYMGEPTEREIEIYAQGLLERYFAPSPFSAKLQELRASQGKLPSDKLTYFAVEEED